MSGTIDFFIDETAALNSRIINFTELNRSIEKVIKPEEEMRQLNIYSFCKYYPQPGEEKTLKLALFFHGKTVPTLVGLADSKGNRLGIQPDDYLTHGSVAYLGKLKTFFFCIPCKKGTLYYRSSIDQDYKE